MSIVNNFIFYNVFSMSRRCLMWIIVELSANYVKTLT